MGYKVKLDQMEAEKKIKFTKRLIFNKFEGMKESEGKGVGLFVEQPASIHVYRKI